MFVVSDYFANFVAEERDHISYYMKTDCFETFFKGTTYEDDYDYNEREQHIIKKA